MQNDNLDLPIEIPIDQISEQAFHAIVESFVLREGTDYGLVEVSFDKKVAQVLKQIQKNEVKIVFDPNTESVTLLRKEEFKIK